MVNPSPSTLVVHAPCKLNLALSVGAPVPPKGYHPIASWFVACDLFDTLHLRRLPGGTTSEHSVAWDSEALKPTPIDWPVHSDLAVRAHRLLESHVARALPLNMRVVKQTPVGGGLGGGSSDAAAALVGIDRLFALNIPSEVLRSLGSSLGSDIPFFIDQLDTVESNRPQEPLLRLCPRPAVVTGFGERIERVAPLPAGWRAVLLFPPFGCPTKDVYAAFDARPFPPFRESAVREIVQRAGYGELDPSDLFNDLAQPAADAQPRLRRLLDQLCPIVPVIGPVHVTGSGSTLFVLIPPDETDRTLVESVRTLAPELALTTVSIA